MSPEAQGVEEEHTFLFSLKHMLTGAETTANYDIVLYATGYQRTAWLELLKHTGIAKDFGLSPASGTVTLKPVLEWSALPQPRPRTYSNETHEESPTSSSATSMCMTYVQAHWQGTCWPALGAHLLMSSPESAKPLMKRKRLASSCRIR